MKDTCHNMELKTAFYFYSFVFVYIKPAESKMAEEHLVNKSESAYGWAEFQIATIEGANYIIINEKHETNTVTVVALVVSGLIILPVNISIMYWMWYNSQVKQNRLKSNST